SSRLMAVWEPMSYDLIAQRFGSGGSHAKASPRAAIMRVLAPFVVDSDEQTNFVRIRTPDGGEADIHLGRTDDGFMANHFSPGEVLDLVFRAAAEADLVIMGPELPALLTNSEQL